MKLELRISIMVLRLLNIIVWRLLNGREPVGLEVSLKQQQALSESQNLIDKIEDSK